MILSDQEISRLLSNKEVFREKEVIEIVSKSRTGIWRDERAGRFPKRVKIGIRAVGWLRSDLMEWLQGLKEQGHQQNGE
jgi:prophage regulatory protein